jgi:hypothetical protein
VRVANWVPLALFFWVLVALWVREWYLRWGSTKEEFARPMPGDADIPDPT